MISAKTANKLSNESRTVKKISEVYSTIETLATIGFINFSFEVPNKKVAQKLKKNLDKKGFNSFISAYDGEQVLLEVEWS